MKLKKISVTVYLNRALEASPDLDTYGYELRCPELLLQKWELCIKNKQKT